MASMFPKAAPRTNSSHGLATRGTTSNTAQPLLKALSGPSLKMELSGLQINFPLVLLLDVRRQHIKLRKLEMLSRRELPMPAIVLERRHKRLVIGSKKNCKMKIL